MYEHQYPHECVIVYVIKDNGDVLLQKKARGFGVGKWNGPGGKIKNGETPEEASRREVREETGLVLGLLKNAGELEFIFRHDERLNNHVHVFLSDDWQGEPIDRGEGELKWHDANAMPYDNMWDDDKYWLQKVLNGAKVNFRFYFDQDGKVTEYWDKLANIRIKLN